MAFGRNSRSLKAFDLLPRDRYWHGYLVETNGHWRDMIGRRFVSKTRDPRTARLADWRPSALHRTSKNGNTSTSKEYISCPKTDCVRIFDISGQAWGFTNRVNAIALPYLHK